MSRNVEKSTGKGSSGGDTVRVEVDAPDGGYGWFCVLGSFLIHLILGGFERSAGLLYLDLERKFEGHSASAISWTFSLNTALRQCLGPVVGILCNRFGYRPVAMVGGMLACAGLLLSAFPPVLQFLYFSYGTLAGIGYAMAYAPSVVVVGLYFSRLRGKAVGIAVSGVGVGGFCIPPLTEAALSFFGYSGAMLILAGIGLNLTVGGALFRPLQQRSIKREIEVFPSKEGSPSDKEPEMVEGCALLQEGDVCQINSQQKPNKDSEKGCMKTFTQKYIDVSLLLDLPFLSFCVGIFLFSVAFQASLVFLSALAKERGLPPSRIALMLSLSGGLDACGRILAGVLFDLPKVVPIRLYLYNLDVLLVAVITLLCTLARNFPSFLAIGAFYGLATGMYISQKSVVIVDLVGQEVLSSSFGLLILFQGMGSLLGPPVAGAFKDKFGKYDQAFYFGSAVTLLAASVMLVGNLVTMRRRRRDKRKITQ